MNELTIILCLSLCFIGSSCQYFYLDNRAGGLIDCPPYLYVHRKTLNANITCTIYNDNFAAKGSAISATKDVVWTLHSDHDEEDAHVRLHPGETNGHYKFIYLEDVNTSSAQAILSFDRIDLNKDYANYTLSIRSPKTYSAVSVKLYERGQGKVPFEWWDYLIFVLILVISALIGVYYGFFAKSDNSQAEYMLGGRQMGWFPVSLSLLASFMSAITLLGTPSEIYSSGTQYILIGVSYPICMIFAAHIFLPIFYNLKITSAYEYLEIRFSKAVRVAGASLFVLQMVVYMSMVVYMPSLALEAVIGLNFWFSALTTAVVCIFYTSMGGMKATMWTDAFQVIMMYIGLVAIFIQGCIREGGFTNAWNRALSRGRVQFWEMNPDPRYRHSFWTMTVGGTFTWMYTYGVNQAQVQRGLSAKTLKTAQISFWINAPTLISMMLIPALCGILIFSRYMDCDPVRAGVISKRDQLLILYVMDIVAEDLPGIPGLFMATLFSAALSTISSGINGLAAVTCRDYGVEEWLVGKGFSESKITWIAKLISVLYGALCIVLIFVIQYLPGLLDSALALFGALGGPLLGIYVCGIFLPWMNRHGALAGLLSSLFLTIWMTIGEKASPHIGLAQRGPSISTQACDAHFISTSRAHDASEEASSGLLLGKFIPERPTDFNRLSGLENLYSVSYLYLSIIGIGVAAIVGMIVSAFTGFTHDDEYASALFHPVAIRIAERFNIRSWKTPAMESRGTLPSIPSSMNMSLSQSSSLGAVEEADANDDSCQVSGIDQKSGAVVIGKIGIVKKSSLKKLEQSYEPEKEDEEEEHHV